MANSIRINFIYNSFLTVSVYLFPIITYPYVSRVLGVANIGICGFVDSIIDFFCVVSLMGIGNMSIREIAKNKNNRNSLNDVFSQLLSLNTISTLIVSFALVIAIYTVPKLQEHKELMYIGLIKLLFNYLTIEWFYKGLENFKYITIRTFVVKLLYVVLIFLFVKQKEDYVVYYLISVIAIVLNAIINIIYSRRFVTFHFVKIISPLYLKPFFSYGIVSILNTLYTTFNVAFLGFVSNETQVGYYTTSYKIVSLILALFMALTTVLLPRMSLLLKAAKLEEFKSKLQMSQMVMISFVIPCVFFIESMSNEIVRLFLGSEYQGSVSPLRIMIPVCFIGSYEQILIVQALIPLNKDKAVLINTIVGAVCGICFNIIFVPLFNSCGSSLVLLISELSVLISAIYFLHKYIAFKMPYKTIFKEIVFTSPIIIICICTRMLMANDTYIIRLLISGILTIMYIYIWEIYIMKNYFYIDILNKIRKVTKL